MKLTKLRLHNFRSYPEAAFEFTDDTTVITGANGIGKTNILEAIYVLAMGRSFRDSDDQLIRHGEDWWRVEAEIDNNQREVRYKPGEPRPKKLIINGTEKGRFMYTHQLPVVLFEPDDLLMIHGSPSTRRNYLDTLLLKFSASYRQILSKYERALLQRNNLLKKRLSPSQLRDATFVWDIALSEYGSKLIDERQILVKNLNTTLQDDYSNLAGKDQGLGLIYEANVAADSHAIAKKLTAQLEKDQLRGFTSVGPHRDDLELVLNGNSAKLTASRGEVRTIILALKFAETSALIEKTGTTPLLLLDDVFSELDKTRQRQLLDFHNSAQKILTATSADGVRAKILQL